MNQYTEVYKKLDQDSQPITMPEQKDEARLLFLLSKGNKQAFDTIYESYWHRVYNEVHKRIKNAALIREITQEVFVQLWIQGNKSTIENLPAYLWITTRISVFKFIDMNGTYTDLQEVNQNHITLRPLL